MNRSMQAKLCIFKYRFSFEYMNEQIYTYLLMYTHREFWKKSTSVHMNNEYIQMNIYIYIYMHTYTHTISDSYTSIQRKKSHLYIYTYIYIYTTC